jgi:hypothetical protein
MKLVRSAPAQRICMQLVIRAPTQSIRARTQNICMHLAIRAPNIAVYE